MKNDRKIIILAAVFAAACIAAVGTGYAAYTGTTNGQSNEIPVQYVKLTLGDNTVSSYTNTFQFDKIPYDTMTSVVGNQVKTQYRAQSAPVSSGAVKVVIDETNGNGQITMKVKLASAYSGGTLSIQFYSDAECQNAVGNLINLTVNDQSVGATFSSAAYYCKVTLNQNNVTDWSDNVPVASGGFSVTFTAEAS